jgi:hypothetical protein
MHTLKTVPLFSIPVSFINFGKEAEDLNEAIIADSFKEQESNPTPPLRSAVDAWQSPLYMQDKYASFAMLRDSIYKVICSVLPQYGFTHDQSKNDELFVCDSLWVNILTNRSAYHCPHIHGTGTTLFSGVYYPTSGLTHDNKDYYPDEDWNDEDIRAVSSPLSGDLVLFDPAASAKQQVLPRFVRKHPYYGHPIYLRPKKSHLVIFPNYLSHMVAPITVDNYKRMSVSFSFTKRYDNPIYL